MEGLTSVRELVLWLQCGEWEGAEEAVGNLGGGQRLL